MRDKFKTNEIRKIQQKKVRQSCKTPEQWLKLNLPNIKHRAKVKGLKFDITHEDVKCNTVCPVFGVEIRPNHPDRNLRPSVDRIDSSKGYEKGNVRMISCRANRCKSDLSYEEIEAMYKNWYTT